MRASSVRYGVFCASVLALTAGCGGIDEGMGLDDTEAPASAAEISRDGVLRMYTGPTAWGSTYYLQTKALRTKVPLLGSINLRDLVGEIVRVQGQPKVIEGNTVLWVSRATRLATVIRGIFRVGVGSETFDSPLPAQAALEQYFGLRPQQIPIGRIVDDRPNTSPYDAQWHWHLERTSLADATMELCDGTPSMVELDLDYWLHSVKVFCPWSGTVLGYR